MRPFANWEAWTIRGSNMEEIA